MTRRTIEETQDRQVKTDDENEAFDGVAHTHTHTLGKGAVLLCWLHSILKKPFLAASDFAIINQKCVVVAYATVEDGLLYTLSGTLSLCFS